MAEFYFIGGTHRGYELLKELLRSNRLPAECIVLKEDDHEKVKVSSSMAELARSRGIPVQIKKKLDAADVTRLGSRTRDFGIVCGWRTLLDPSLNASLKLGLIAAHDSLLPAYRGFAPMSWAILNGETQTGVTLFQIGEGEVDSGDILLQKSVLILPDDRAQTVLDRLTQATVELYLQLFEDYSAGRLKPVRQNSAAATYTCKRIPEDGRIVWSDSAQKIHNLCRALSDPLPGAFCQHKADTYSILETALGAQNAKKFAGRIPGRVIAVTEEGIEVMCGEGTLLVKRWETRGSGRPDNPARTIRSITETLK